MTTNNRNYRGWSSDEDEKLIDALVSMVNSGAYKSDNGFKSGFLQHLEACLKESLPGSGILGKPHIESRIKTMKRDWQAVHDLVNASGFGYDKENHSVTTNAPGVWEAYIENHKNAAKWRHRQLPHYEEMCVVFGKDRAQGNRAKDAVEMEQEVNTEEHENHGDDVLDELSHNEGTNASFQGEETSSDRGNKRKRKSDYMFQSFNEAVVLFGDRLKETSAELSEDIKFELDIKKKTLMIPEELAKLTSLTQLDRFRAIEKIKDDQNRVMTFWSLGEDEREAWVEFLLDG